MKSGLLGEMFKLYKYKVNLEYLVVDIKNILKI